MATQQGRKANCLIHPAYLLCREKQNRASREANAIRS